MAEGKRIFREACDEKKSWNAEVSQPLRKDWFRWMRQLRNVRVSLSVVKNLQKIKAVHLHIYADASNLTCSCITIVIIEQDNLEKEYFNTKIGVSKRTNGWEHGEEHMLSTKKNAYRLRNGFDGQFSSTFLDIKSC
jgi:hypothetical protein